ncbi:MAG: bifunctional folylpolyglutamate synthase/dihydrofolate synthase [Candidatus Sulfobium sp.]|jgi:dihydrofolate synthase/folylpolyglutamate synthase
MRYKRSIEYLYGLQKYGMKFGLDNITRLLYALGNPHHSFRSVHVAGTNGKGSTAAMTESIIRTSGGRTGLFTSPHLVSFTERIRIDGREISQEEVSGLAEEVKGAVERIGDFSPTFFEVVTAMAFLCFRRNNVGWAVVEVGLGGRLDATNVILPEVTVITAIALDHREFLGDTVREVAAEKAGVIKPGVPVVSAPQGPEAIEVIESRSSEKGSLLFRCGRDFSSSQVREDAEGLSFSYRGEREYDGLRLPLAGEHQAINAALAVKTTEILTGKYPGMRCNIRKGLGMVRWPGRIEIVRKNPTILIDGAHNPDAASALSVHLGRMTSGGRRRIIMVVGIMGDKDIDGILRPLLPLASTLIFTSPSYSRAASVEVLSARAASLGHPCVASTGVADALRKAEALYLPGDIIVVTGSFYTIGEAKEILSGRGVLSRLRE